VIRVCDEAGNVIETHEHSGDFRRTLKDRSHFNRTFIEQNFLRPRGNPRNTGQHEKTAEDDAVRAL
jgi:hypothetical protein